MPQLKPFLRAGTAVIAVMAAFVVQPGTGPAPPIQAQSSSAQRIANIEVRGNQRIERSTILSYLTLERGDAFDLAAVDQSLKTLFATGLFSDARLFREGSTLVVEVDENPIVNRVAFEGNRRLNEEDLSAETQLRPRIVFTPAKAQADAQRLIELYRRSGRFAATVEPKIVRLPQNRVDLIFEIDEGETTGIARINILGNEEFSDAELRGAIATKESRFFRFFSSNDNYDPDRLEFDRALLRQFYTSRGYADFTVRSAVAELTPDRSRFFLTFVVEEGPVYNFGDIEVTTELDRLNERFLEGLVATREGELFNGQLIEESIDSLTFAAGASGYANVDIRPRLERNPEDQTVDLTYEVVEGPRVYVDRIEIQGNVATLDRVIRREMQLTEGDAFNQLLVDRSRRRIRGLGFFSEVEIEEEPGDAPDRTDLIVDVEEQATGELSVGAGFSSTDNFLIDLSISQRNLLGRGQFLRFRISLSDRQRIYELRFREPYFLNRRLAAGFDIFRTRIDFSREGSFRNTTTGLGLRTGFPVARDLNLQLRYTVRSDNIDFIGLSCDPNFAADFNGDGEVDFPVICTDQGTQLTSELGYSLVYDQRNDPIRPSRGYIISLSQDVAGLGGSERYLRSRLDARWFRSIVRNDVIFSLGTDIGYVFGFDGDVRLNDRFFRGAESFRGFEPAGVGPRDTIREFDDTLGGQLVAIGRAELTFPLGLPESFGVRGGIFSDFGTVGLLSDDITDLRPEIRDDLSIRVSAGFSLFWRSPFGPIRIDLAQVFQREDYDELEQFRFGASTQF